MLLVVAATVLPGAVLGEPEMTGRRTAQADDAALEKIETLRRERDWQALAVRLQDKRPDVRGRAAVALHQGLAREADQAVLEKVIPALLTASLNDSSVRVRDPARFALRSALEKVDDQQVLIEVMQALLANLRHRDDVIRAHCAHDLSGVIGRIEDPAVLAKILVPLGEATLKSESMDADDFSGFALRNALRKIDDESVLVPAMRILLAGLKHKNASMRSYCAHDLSENMGKIEDEAALVQMMGPLTASALQADDESRARLSSGFALRQILCRIDDPTALRSAVAPLARALAAGDVAQRRYAAHAVTLFAHKLDPAVLTPLTGPLVHAHFHDPDERVRELSARALQQAFDRSPEANEGG
jgi:hypothetical protein